MATWDDVSEIAAQLPEVATGTAYGHHAWQVRGKTFVWERPLRTGDVQALGAAASDEPVLAARVPDLAAKDALVAERGPYFTVPHFDGYLAILVWLPRIETAELEELIVEAWLSRAPKRLVSEYLRENPGDGGWQ